MTLTYQKDVTATLAKKEQGEHLEEMAPASDAMRKRPLIVYAYPVDDPNAPLVGKNVKCVHFVRHGQGFHNLMADLALAQGRKWENVSDIGLTECIEYQRFD